MDVTIHPFIPDDAGYGALAALAAQTPGELGDYEYARGDAFAAFDRAAAGAGLAVRRVVARRGGETAGYAQVFPVCWSLGSQRHWLVLRVAPAHRRAGVGLALLERALGLAEADGAGALVTQVRESHAGAAEAMGRRGFRELLRGWEYRLDPRIADLSGRAGAVLRAAERGVTLTSLADERERNPGWLAPLAALHRRLVYDIPVPEEPLFDDAWFAAFALRLPEAFFIARQGDAYVGASFMHPHDAEPGVLAQKITGVLHEQRGAGLAGALKLLTIDYAARAGASAISTWIESNNAPMLAVSERLGFRRHPSDGLILLELPLSPQAEG